MQDTLSLYRLAEARNIDVDFRPLRNAQSLSLPMEWAGGRCAVALDPGQFTSAADEKVKLGHELGHCVTGSFYNRYAALDLRRRHELHADRWAIAQLIPRRELDRALEQGVREVWELAEHFEVTEEFMKKALAHYGLWDADD